jgi:hypothetical protein
MDIRISMNPGAIDEDSRDEKIKFFDAERLCCARVKNLCLVQMKGTLHRCCSSLLMMSARIFVSGHSAKK